MFEAGLGGMDHLFGSECAAGMAAHAVGDDGQCHATLAGMLKDRDAILLFLAISLVLCGARINCYRHCFSLSGARLARKKCPMQR
jgi:hypothetical protein